MIIFDQLNEKDIFMRMAVGKCSKLAPGQQ